MYVERHEIPILTDAEGNAEVFSPPLMGRILGVRIVVPGSGGIENTSDLTLTAERTGEAILTLTNQDGSASYYPRAAVHGTTGAGLTYDGTRPVAEPVALALDRVKVVVAEGGNAKAATLILIVG